ncbi:MAG: 50S ribosomal protein L27 [Candidatus Liptonbacteria bacterium]|nr:50S ribosomal protein L27 [Candidatus Liptonbacteria bacterium]
MAHTQSGGSTKLGRDSRAKRLGVKIHDGQLVNIGQIIIRQRGAKYLFGKNIRMGGDNTLYALKNGVIKFGTKIKRGFDGRLRRATVVNVQ